MSTECLVVREYQHGTLEEYYFGESNPFEVPKSIEEARHSFNAPQWEEAIQAEIVSVNTNNTFLMQ